MYNELNESFDIKMLNLIPFDLTKIILDYAKCGGEVIESIKTPRRNLIISSAIGPDGNIYVLCDMDDIIIYNGNNEKIGKIFTAERDYEFECASQIQCSGYLNTNKDYYIYVLEYTSIKIFGNNKKFHGTIDFEDEFADDDYRDDDDDDDNHDDSKEPNKIRMIAYNNQIYVYRRGLLSYFTIIEMHPNDTHSIKSLCGVIENAVDIYDAWMTDLSCDKMGIYIYRVNIVIKQ